MRRLSAVLLALAVGVLAVGPADAARLITGKQIKNKSIKAVDLASESVTASKLHQSAFDELAEVLPPGPQGPVGAQGPQGAPGPSGIQSIVSVRARTMLCAGATSCAIGSAVAFCPGGTKPVSGGGAALANYGLFQSRVASSGGQAVGWVASGDNFDGALEGYVEADVYCSSGVGSFQGPSQQRSARDVVAERLAMHRG